MDIEYMELNQLKDRENYLQKELMRFVIKSKTTSQMNWKKPTAKILVVISVDMMLYQISAAMAGITYVATTFTQIAVLVVIITVPPINPIPATPSGLNIAQGRLAKIISMLLIWSSK